MAAVLKQIGHTDRKAWLGGSDVAPIMSVSDWATPADIYYRKKGLETEVKIDPVRERIFKRGKRLEPVVIEMLKDELGIKVTKVSPPEKPNRYADSEFPFMAAEIDFEWEVRQEDIDRFPWAKNLRVGSIQNGEVKTVGPFAAAKWGEMDTDEVPIEYAFQSMHGLAITGRDVCMYGVLFGSDNLVTYAVHNDPETVGPMRAKLAAFWRDYVLANVVPPPQRLGDLQRMYLKASLAKAVATDEQAEVVAALHVVKDQMKALEAREEELEFQLKHAIADNEALVTAGGKVLATWKNSTHSGLNQEALKERMPEVHAEFYETKDIRRFCLTGRRGRK